MSRVDVLMVAPLPKPIVEPLEAEFTVHRLWQAVDRNRFLGEVADTVRGIATSGMDGADAALIGALPKLEIISCFGVGVDPIDLDAAATHKVIVTNTPDVLTDDVADLALALALAVTRRVAEGDRFVRAGRWLRGNLPLGARMAGRTAGIVGLGRIGQATARRAEACGMTVVYHGPRQKPDQPYRYYDDLKAMAADADILILTCPGGAATQHMVDAAILEALGPKGMLINVARGSVVDQPALVRALESGGLAGAGLDVFEHEPEVPQALIGLDNVVLLPHLGSATVETRQAMCDLVVENLRRHFAGQPVLTPVN